EGIDMAPYYRFHTPDGVHSVSGHFEHWHLLDALYRTFQGEAADVKGWSEGSKAVRAVIVALDELQGLEQLSRPEHHVASADVQRAAEVAVELAQEDYIDEFLEGVRPERL
ncbi:unnamed protein product, partial [Polarella glacialis]